ncbi:hypothetical protein, partial [Arthrobacter sedimenti]
VIRVFADRHDTHALSRCMSERHLRVEGPPKFHDPKEKEDEDRQNKRHLDGDRAALALPSHFLPSECRSDDR